MQQHNKKNPIILFVDHHPIKAEALISEIKGLIAGPVKRQPLSHFFEVRLKKVNISGDDFLSSEILNTIAQEIYNEYSNEMHPLIIFVDLNMVHRYPDFKNGISLADAIKNTFSQVPVWVYTQQQWSVDALYFASTKAIDGMLNLNNLSTVAENLWALLHSCHNIQQEKLATSMNNQFRSPSWFKINWDEVPSDKGPYSLKSAVEALAFRIFGGNKNISKLVFKQLKPGFSGTQLVKVIPFDTNNISLSNIWVLKIAEHRDEIEKLERELEGYDVVFHRIPRNFRPELYSHDIDYIIDDWWGGFAMSFEGNFDTLIERFLEIKPEAIYSKVFNECLKKLYSECQELDSTLNLPSEQRDITKSCV